MPATDIQKNINKYEETYFKKIKKILSENGTTIFRNLTTQYNFSNLETSFDGQSKISDGMERVIQSIISENTDWEIFSLPDSSDSSFITPKCVIQIDCKSTLLTDSDSTGHKVNVGKNQTSYASNADGIIYKNYPFKSNIPFVYRHNIYGELYSTTYFVKLHYDDTNGIESFGNFDIYLACIPNGHLQSIYGVSSNLFNSGRDVITPLYNEMDEELFVATTTGLEPEEIEMFNKAYDLGEDGKRRLRGLFYITTKRTDEEKKIKKDIESVYNKHKINAQRDSLRFLLNELKVDANGEFAGSEFDWKRYEKLDLI